MVFANFVLITEANIETKPEANVPELQWVLCIWYLAQFKIPVIEALIHLSNNIYIIWSSFAEQLSLYIQKMDIRAQKIDDSQLITFGMVIAFFLVDVNDRKSYFLEETFLLADIKLHVTSGIPFLTLSNVQIDFNN